MQKHIYLFNFILFASFINAQSIGSLPCGNIFTINTPDNFPEDISFLSADIKIYNSTLKFCEIEDAVYNAIRKACYLPSGSQEEKSSFYLPDWENFLSFLAQFKIPIMYVGYIKQSIKQIIKQLNSKIIKYYPTLENLERDYLPKIKTLKKSSLMGIVIYRETKKSNTLDSNKFKLFKSKHPEFLYVNNFIRKFIADKKNLYLLFNKTLQQNFLPKFGVYNKTCSAAPAQQIKTEIASKFFIIKPSNEIKSHGICMIKSDALEQTLSTILKQKRVTPKFDKQLNYWKNNTDKDLIVMEYAPSDEILYHDQWYDPTLRISFILYHIKNRLGVILQNCFCCLSKSV